MTERKITLSENYAKMQTINYQVDKIYLTQSEIYKLRTVELSEHLDRVRNVFLFG